MAENSYDFNDKVVIITGGGTGIGRAIARDFLRNGATVVVAGVRKEPLEEAVKGFGRGFVHQTDVSDPGAVKDLVESTVAKLGHLDVVVNNAGIFEGGKIGEVSEEVWHRIFSVNLDGLFHLTKASLPHLMKSGGNIVVVSSVSGMRGDWGQTTYNATKHAINGFVQCAALDYGEYGVRVNAIAPAFIETDINKDVWTDSERLKPYVSRVALNRTGTAEDCAGPVLFLASEDAKYLTGVILPVDGGTTAATGQGRNSYD